MVPAPQAIKLAFTQAASRWATGLFAVLASMAESFAGVVALLAGISWVAGHEKAAPIALGASVATLLAARLLLAFVQGGAIRQSAAWLKGEGTGTALEEMFAAAPQSLAWFLWTLPIELLATLWKWAGLAAVLYAYGRALGGGTWGAVASLTLALFATLALPLAIGWAGLRRATLVTSVRERVGPFAAATAALGSLVARPGAFFAVLLVGLAGAGLAEVVLSIVGSAVSPDSGAGLEPLLASQLASGALAAFTGALFELVILYGFTALESQPTSPPTPAPAAPAPVPLQPSALL